MSKDDLKKYREVAGALGKALSKAIGCRENNRLIRQQMPYSSYSIISRATSKQSEFVYKICMENSIRLSTILDIAAMGYSAEDIERMPCSPARKEMLKMVTELKIYPR